MFVQVRREFRALLNDEHVGTLKQLWPDWAEKILAMGRMESANRPAVKIWIARVVRFQYILHN